jgi:hypothetical protein
VVFGVGKKRGRPKDSKNWTDIQYHHLAALYIEIKSKQPKLSDSKIAEVIAKMSREPKEVIRKRLSSGVPPPVLTEVFGAEKDELLKILAQIPIPIPGKLAAISGKLGR